MKTAILLPLLLMSSCNLGWFSHYEDDNFVEEVVEDVIEEETGAKVDLTPWSPEE